MKENVEIFDSSLVRIRSRVMDYVELMKPELTFLCVLTTLCGIYLGTIDHLNLWLFFNAAIGTTLVGGGAGALNQFMERHFDSEMKRTERRPLPSGRIAADDAFIFGLTISILGVMQVVFFVNVLTGVLAVLTLIIYLLVYTPLKRKTWYNTLIGGVPGALPAMAGWTAVRNEISVEAWILFAILFFWQMPHFFSLAWMYKKDYARAGYKMITVNDVHGKRTSRQILWYCLALIPASLFPTYVGMTGLIYLLGASVLGISFLLFGIYFAKFTSNTGAEAIVKTNYYSRKMFFASLVYLPILMLLMTLDKM